MRQKEEYLDMINQLSDSETVVLLIDSKDGLHIRREGTYRGIIDALTLALYRIYFVLYEKEVNDEL
jgi:hypothetical protein